RGIGRDLEGADQGPALCGIQHGLSSTPLLADPEERRRYTSGAAREDRAAHRVRGDGAPEDVVRVRFPSGLSPSVQEFHLVSRSPEAIGSRTVTAVTDIYRLQCT